jgi:dTDP-4-amino-4,6-dideoxygalactose transaminase
MIPLVDLKANLATIRAEVDVVIRKVIDDTAFILGPAVESFERDFAAYVGVKHAIGVQSGTAALQLMLLASGVGPGDEVITAPSSFFASAEAISLTGARPVFVDVEPDTLNLDASKLETAITPRTKALVPVHLYGQAADMAGIVAIAARRGIPIIEDACQAHGATFGDKKLGSIGLGGAFSFYPGKNLGAFGEGGAVTTSNDELAGKIRRLRDHGSPEKYRHTMVGFNYRLEGIQGAVLGVKLKHLDRWNDARRRLAARYDQKLRGVGDLVLPVDRKLGRHVYHLYAVRSPSRERIFARFAERNIVRASHYPIPIHLQEAYAGLGLGKGSYPVAEAAAEQTFSLPMYPELSEAQQDQVVEAVVSAF